MLYYIYDGSFTGLLSAIYEIYYRRQVPDALLAGGLDCPNLFAEEEIITTDESKAGKVYDAIDEKIGSRSLRNAYNAYLSEHPESPLWIYNYLDLGWKLGSRLDMLLTDERVRRIHSLSQKVGLEKHRMLGLLRFQLVQTNTYYAAIEPDSNIVELIAPHFATRMANQDWVIHDIKRNLAAIYNQKEWVSTPLTLQESLELTREEKYYQKLWQQYYAKIAVTSRINPRLQRQCMPQRYWKHLVEIL